MNNTRQVVLVTGASSGSGKAIARTLLTEGYTVYAVARRPRTRYVVGRMARPLIWARRWLGDRLYDWVVRRSIT